MASIQIMVQRQDDDLNRRTYFFWYDDSRHALIVDRYSEETRQSKRHGWRRLGWYNRLSQRDSNIKHEAVVLPEDVQQDAAKQFADMLIVTTWAAVGGRP